MAEKSKAGWLTRRREKKREKQLRTGDTPERTAEGRKPGDPTPGEKADRAGWTAGFGGGGFLRLPSRDLGFAHELVAEFDEWPGVSRRRNYALGLEVTADRVVGVTRWVVEGKRDMTNRPREIQSPGQAIRVDDQSREMLAGKANQPAGAGR